MLRILSLYFLFLHATNAPAQNVAGNIFIKTDISRTNCFVGEPVVVTFTLFSSAPAIISGQRSPAFYGFSIVDLINYKEPVSGVAEWNGRVYATSVLRKVLLYPVQPGVLVIDPMYVETVSEVFDSIQREKSEVTKEVVSQRFEITVHALPGLRPSAFAGAVGKFNLGIELKPASFPVSQQGKLIVILKGSGNFINAGHPRVLWPKGVEGFEPVIKDDLRNTDSGISGIRMYEFTFAVDSPGSYQLPPVSFSYFDTEEKKYKLLQTGGVDFNTWPAPGFNERIIASGKENSFVILITLLVLAMGSAIFLLIRNRKLKNSGAKEEPPLGKINFVPSFTKEGLAVMNENQVASALLQSLDQFILKTRQDISRGELAEAKLIKDELQLMVYANAIERDRLDALAIRSFHLFERNHSAYL